MTQPPDPIDESSRESFPASDPPSWEPLHAGRPSTPARAPAGRVEWALARTIFFAVFFIWLWGWFVARWVIGAESWHHPASAGAQRIIAIAAMAVGLAVAVGCALEFAVRGLGTPAHFDPPRRLVIRGLYRYVRNPMYIGTITALAGEALYFASWGLALVAAGFFAGATLFIKFVEEPALTRQFGAEYDAYRARVHRWIPKL